MTRHQLLSMAYANHVPIYFFVRYMNVYFGPCEILHLQFHQDWLEMVTVKAEVNGQEYAMNLGDDEMVSVWVPMKDYMTLQKEMETISHER